MTQAGELVISLTTDAKACAYVVSEANDGTEYLTRFDLDGNLIYRVPALGTPPVALATAGNFYAALYAGGVAKIDAAGNMAAFPSPFGYLDGAATDPRAISTTPGA